jgi:serine/threonine protein kinase
MSAIAYMHEKGIVHRDLKAENLLLVDNSEDYPTVKLIDFGFSTILHHNLTGSFLGMYVPRLTD